MFPLSFSSCHYLLSLASCLPSIVLFLISHDPYTLSLVSFPFSSSLAPHPIIPCPLPYLSYVFPCLLSLFCFLGISPLIHIWSICHVPYSPGPFPCLISCSLSPPLVNCAISIVILLLSPVPCSFLHAPLFHFPLPAASQSLCPFTDCHISLVSCHQSLVLLPVCIVPFPFSLALCPWLLSLVSCTLYLVLTPLSSVPWAFPHFHFHFVLSLVPRPCPLTFSP